MGTEMKPCGSFMVVTVKCRKGSVTCIGRGVISLSSYMIFVEISFAFMKGIKKIKLLHLILDLILTVIALYTSKWLWFTINPNFRENTVTQDENVFGRSDDYSRSQPFYRMSHQAPPRRLVQGESCVTSRRTAAKETTNNI